MISALIISPRRTTNVRTRSSRYSNNNANEAQTRHGRPISAPASPLSATHRHVKADVLRYFLNNFVLVYERLEIIPINLVRTNHAIRIKNKPYSLLERNAAPQTRESVISADKRIEVSVTSRQCDIHHSYRRANLPSRLKIVVSNSAFGIFESRLF